MASNNTQELTEREQLFELSHKFAVTNIESMIENSEATENNTSSSSSTATVPNSSSSSSLEDNVNSLSDSSEGVITIEEKTLKRLKNDPAYDANIRAQFLISPSEQLFAGNVFFLRERKDQHLFHLTLG